MTANDRRQLETTALAYLRAQLGHRAPPELCFAGEFSVGGLEGEGVVTLFSLELPETGLDLAAGSQSADRRHYVAVGETQPNFFPAYGMDADGAFSFHLGTRFMLELELQLVGPELEPPGARDLMRAVVAEYGGGQAIEREELAALFRCEEGLFAVYRLTIGGQDVYCMGADCPPGFYAMTEYPPQVALRLHLGGLIRAEASRELSST